MSALSLLSISKLPHEVISQLKLLDIEFLEGDVTEKGYYKHKWRLLQPFAGPHLSEKISSLENRLETANLTVAECMKQMKSLLGIGTNLRDRRTVSNESTSLSNCSPIGFKWNDSNNGDSSNNYEVGEVDVVHKRVSTPMPKGNSSNKKNSKSLKRQHSSRMPLVVENGSPSKKIEYMANQIYLEHFLKQEEKDEIEVVNVVTPEKRRKLDRSSKSEQKKRSSIKESNNDSSSGFSTPNKKPLLSVSTTKKTSKSNLEKEKKSGAEKCKICRQYESALLTYEGHPSGAVEESVALSDPRLDLSSGSESEVSRKNEIPQIKMTNFNVYDKEGHLCPFDTGLIEGNISLYVSGYAKPLNDCSDVAGYITMYDIGPITDWWITGFNIDERAIIGVSTISAKYHLLQPSDMYKPIMEALIERLHLGKHVIQFLLDERNPSFADLLNNLKAGVSSKKHFSLADDLLLKNAQFIFDLVQSFDMSDEKSDIQLITTPCMRTLMKMGGVTLGKRREMGRIDRQHILKHSAKSIETTTTALIDDVVESFYKDEINKQELHNEDLQNSNLKRCGTCGSCQEPNCGTCSACLEKTNSGGTGRTKQACIRRRCLKLAIQEADEESDNEEDLRGVTDDTKSHDWSSCPRGIRTQSEKRNIVWVGDVIKEQANRTFYGTVSVDGKEHVSGQFVAVEATSPGVAVHVGLIKYMWQDNHTKEKYFHTQWFCRGVDTVLGDAADDQELFELYECEDLPMCAIKSSVNVKYIPASSTWNSEDPSRSTITSENSENNGMNFFYQKRYDPEHCRFEDLQEDLPCRREEMKHRFCSSCERIYLQQKYETPSIGEKMGKIEDNKEVYYGVVKWRGEEYRIGSFVFLVPHVFNFKYTSVATNPISSGRTSVKKELNDDTVDEQMYPERFRKSLDQTTELNNTTVPPFCIGYITAIFTNSRDKLVVGNDICLKVNKMYRPENTHKGSKLVRAADLNMIYWSQEEMTVNFGDVMGKCYVMYPRNLEGSLHEWISQGPNRFYYTQAYDSSKEIFADPPAYITQIVSDTKGKVKIDKKKLKSKLQDEKVDVADWPNVSRLRCLDVFSGCGGFSRGLSQSGVADVRWAVEPDEAAAQAFRLNHSDVAVFTDSNDLLKKVINGNTVKIEKGLKIPQKGEVDLLCGGPPYHNYNGVNAYNLKQHLKNSEVVNYLSYCDFYRPRFFVLENVSKFISAKRSILLKLTLKCLLRMGYQCTFGVLQAGSYGVPLLERKTIILAAAPGEVLPSLPEPTHTFDPKAMQLTVTVDDKKFMTNCKWVYCAPRRAITVRDATSDLPEIMNGDKNDIRNYRCSPMSHFQRQMRGPAVHFQPVLSDHICKKMSPLIVTRIANIPLTVGSDWRDLPNTVVCLPDRTYTEQLQYRYHDKKNGKSSTGALRGVCACVSGNSCEPEDQQVNTLIPWCLSHTSNDCHNWVGLYGRIDLDGYFGVACANPEPMGKQGRVLHPEQIRVVSVRECARSKGLQDTFVFSGSMTEKYRQVATAVPPPLAESIGYEIRKSIHQVKANVPASSETALT